MAKIDTEMLRAAIGAGTRKARKAMQLTQEEASEHLGIAGEYFARIDRGHAMPSVPVLQRIAIQLNVSVDALLQTRFESRFHLREQPADEGERDSPEVRRLLRRLRRAKPSTRHLVGWILAEIEKLGPDKSSPSDDP